MTRPILVGTALSALLPLACTSEQPPDPPPPNATADASSAPSEPKPPSPDPSDPAGGGPVGSPCQVDADCAVGLRCELRICIAGCQADDDCTALQTCDPHGRCQGEAPSAPSLAGAPQLAEYHTLLPWGEVEARTTLHNDGPAILLYRLESLSPAVLVDQAPAELAPGDTIDLVATVDRDLLDPSEHALTVRLITSGGPGRWTIEPATIPDDSIFRGMVALDVGGLSIGSSDLVVALDFRDDGTLVGQVEPGALLFPHPITASGTWTPAGDVSLVVREVLPPADWQESPLAREIGRTFVLAGTVAADGRTIEGTAEETVTGLRDVPLQATGTFVLRQHEPLGDPLILPPQAVPEDILPPAWLTPDDYDDAACDGLGAAYGTPDTLPEPSLECDACADGTCSPQQMLQCGDALWTAAYQLPGVLAGLQGVTPPSGAFTWADCTAESPAYKDGTACLDAHALRCATSLFRRGAPQIPGAWGEAFTHYAAFLANREAEAAALLATEATIDGAFAYKDDLGEPATDVLARELDILADARAHLSGTLVPLLTPAYLDGLDYIRAHNPDSLPATAATTELRLGTRLADLTAAWARLSLRAGDDPTALRGQIQRAAIDLHALALEAHARNPDDPAADFQALAATWDTLALAFRDLGPEANPFGYAAAYVPMALGPEDIEQGRTNFDAVHAFAADDVTTFADLASAAWQAMRDYEEKTHSTQATTLQLTADFDAKLRALCGALPGDTAPDLATCGQHGGQIAELDAAVAAAGVRIDQAVQTLENNHHAVAVEEERFATQAQAIAELGDVIDALHDEIFAIVDEHGQNRTMMTQFQALSEYSNVQRAAKEQMDVIRVECKARVQKELLSGPAIFGFSTPDWRGIHLARKACEAEKEALAASTQAQCDTILGQAGLQTYLEDQARQEQVEIMAVNAEIDAAIRETDLKIAHAASIALIKNLRAEALLLALEIREAEIAREATLTALWSAYGEVAALTLEKARALGLLVDDDPNPNNTLVSPHFLAARQHAASRVLRAREHLTRRLYLALRALEYDLGQPLPTLRDQLLAARAPADFTGLLSCLDSIAEDYRLTHGYGQAYTTEVSLRADVFGITTDLPDVDGTPATPAEQFQALLHDPAHRQLDGTIALPFTLSATPGHTLFSTWLCDDRLDQIEVKLIGDYLGDREAEVLLTRQGLATVRRCDAVNLAPSVAHAEYSFDREQVVLQAGVSEWGPPNAGFAAWPVHGEQWTLTIPPASQSPANTDLDADDIADVVLRLHHRASTLAPEGQGLFTPSCG